MANLLRPTAIALSLVFLGSCAAHKAPDPHAQKLVETIAAEHKDVTRPSVHAKPAGKTDYIYIASTEASRRAKTSDPEDLKAIQTGQMVVLEENGGFDVTVPICQMNSAYTAAAGVTFKPGVAREAAVAQAKAIASSLNSGMMTPKK